MKMQVGIILLGALILSPSPAFAKKSKAQIAKELAAEIARSEAWAKTKEMAQKAYQKEKNCKNVQGGNNANSTAAIRAC